MIHFENARVKTSFLFSRITQSGWLFPLNLAGPRLYKPFLQPGIEQGSAKAPAATDAKGRHGAFSGHGLKGFPVHFEKGCGLMEIQQPFKGGFGGD